MIDWLFHLVCISVKFQRPWNYESIPKSTQHYSWQKIQLTFCLGFDHLQLLHDQSNTGEQGSDKIHKLSVTHTTRKKRNTQKTWIEWQPQSLGLFSITRANKWSREWSWITILIHHRCKPFANSKTPQRNGVLRNKQSQLQWSTRECRGLPIPSALAKPSRHDSEKQSLTIQARSSTKDCLAKIFPTTW